MAIDVLNLSMGYYHETPRGQAVRPDTSRRPAQVARQVRHDGRLLGGQRRDRAAVVPGGVRALAATTRPRPRRPTRSHRVGRAPNPDRLRRVVQQHRSLGAHVRTRSGAVEHDAPVPGRDAAADPHGALRARPRVDRPGRLPRGRLRALERHIFRRAIDGRRVARLLVEDAGRDGPRTRRRGRPRMGRCRGDPADREQSTGAERLRTSSVVVSTPGTRPDIRARGILRRRSKVASTRSLRARILLSLAYVEFELGGRETGSRVCDGHWRSSELPAQLVGLIQSQRGVVLGRSGLADAAQRSTRRSASSTTTPRRGCAAPQPRQRPPHARRRRQGHRRLRARRPAREQRGWTCRWPRLSTTSATPGC